MRNRLSILRFHRVLSQADPFRRGDVTGPAFDRICASLARFFNVITLGEAGTALRERGRLPDRAVTITFDDGFADNAELAAPILKRHGINASFFVSTGFLNGGIMFNDAVIEAVKTARQDAFDLASLGIDLSGQRSLETLEERVQLVRELLDAIKYRAPDERLALARRLTDLLDADPPPTLMMTPEQVAQMAQQGFEIGGHTVNHPILTEISAHDAAREIREGRQQLQAITQQGVHSFAYPNGRPDRDYDSSHVTAVAAAGFDQAVTTAWGCARHDDDPLQLPRLSCWDRRAITFVPRMMAYYLRGDRGTQLPRERAAVA